MTVQTDFLRVGFLVSDNDFRNSTITGTTWQGPNGSGQFLPMRVSTANTLAFTLCTTSTIRSLGILQNTPSTGIAGDINILGVSKVVAGSTSITLGQELMIGSSSGTLIAFTTTSNYSVGRALEVPSAVGALFAAFIYGSGGYGASF